MLTYKSLGKKIVMQKIIKYMSYAEQVSKTNLIVIDLMEELQSGVKML
jgi:hypothetical protein